MRAASAATIREVLRQHNSYPWTWLYDLQLEYSPANELRFLCNNGNSLVTWNGEQYPPFPVSQGVLESNSQGDAPQFQVTFDNRRRDLARYVWITRGFVGLAIKLTVLNLRSTNNDDGLYAEFEATGSHVTEAGITILCELPNFVNLPIPEAIFTVSLCGWDYMFEDCGYIGSLPACRKDLVDCEAHGADEAANGRPRHHPRRFGAFNHLPRQIA